MNIDKQANIIAGSILVIIGCLYFFVVTPTWWSRGVLQFRGVTVMGSVTDYEKVESPRRPGRFYLVPVFTFKTADGETRSFNPGTYGSSDHPINEEVPVRYDPVDPGNAAVYRWFDMWFALFLRTSAGCAFFLGGLYYLAKAIGIKI